MIASTTLLLHWLGAGFAVLAIVAAGGVVTARAHFATCLLIAATSAMAALALLCFGAGGAALAVALVGVGLVPVLMLGGVLLSARAIRGGKGGSPRFVTVAVAAVAVALIWATQDVVPPTAPLATPVGIGFWLTALVFVTGLVCAGLLGYGERGALAPRMRGDA